MGDHADDIYNSYVDYIEPNSGEPFNSGDGHILDSFKYEEIVRETDKSWLVKLKGKEPVWYPKSQCKLDHKKNMINIPRWLQKRK